MGRVDWFSHLLSSPTISTPPWLANPNRGHNLGSSALRDWTVGPRFIRTSMHKDAQHQIHKYESRNDWTALQKQEPFTIGDRWDSFNKSEKWSLSVSSSDNPLVRHLVAGPLSELINKESVTTEYCTSLASNHGTSSFPSVKLFVFANSAVCPSPHNTSPIRESHRPHDDCPQSSTAFSSHKLLYLHHTTIRATKTDRRTGNRTNRLMTAWYCAGRSTDVHRLVVDELSPK